MNEPIEASRRMADEEDSGRGKDEVIRSTYFVPGLTPAQRAALDRIGCGDYALDGVSGRTIERLLQLELIEPCGERVICRDRFGTVTATEYQMPLGVHFAWSMYGAAEYDKLPDSEKLA